MDDQLEYFFATVEFDFAAPAGRGVSDAEIEALLDGIPARRKLLLVDTCHSGEVEERATAGKRVAVDSGEEGTLKKRGLKRKQTAAEKPRWVPRGFAHELFSDLRRGTGAVVITSAGGLEFAMEAERWQNGVFTYAVLEALGIGAADVDGNAAVTVAELRRYVIERVPELTGGEQTPTSRRENLEVDFVVY